MNIKKEFEIELGITGFKLKIGGSRSDMPAMSENLTRQIAGLITPAANIVQGEVGARIINAEANGSPESGKRGSARTRRSSSKNEKQTVNWTYDGQLYGTPQQSWSGNDKAIWVLYVADKVMGVKQMGAAQITNTFNTHYQAAKRIHRGNVYRGLDNLRTAEDAPVGKHDDGSFFLTQKGYEWAEKLIASVTKPQPTA